MAQKDAREYPICDFCVGVLTPRCGLNSTTFYHPPKKGHQSVNFGLLGLRASFGMRPRKALAALKNKVEISGDILAQPLKSRVEVHH